MRVYSRTASGRIWDLNFGISFVLSWRVVLVSEMSLMRQSVTVVVRVFGDSS